MKFKLLHEIRGRLRIHILNRYSQADFDKLFCALNAERQIKRCRVYPATNDLMIEYVGSRADAIKAIAERVGVDRFYAEVLPEEKARFILDEKAKVGENHA